MSKEENMRIFTDSMDLCNTMEKLKHSIELSKNCTEFVLEKDTMDDITDEKLNRFENEANVVVSKKRTLEAASKYDKDGLTAVLNFASATNPGGGVAKGSSAQEEALCRISTLYPCINTEDCLEKFYKPHREAKNPLHNGDIIYTPGVTVFKSDTNNPKVLNQNDWYRVDVITCAAPNLRPNPANPYCPDEKGKAVKVTDVELLDIHKTRFRKILDTAVRYDDDNIILGAFGCGAFQNKPEVVARAAKEVIKDYKHAFKNIEFAVFCGNDDTNYKVFNRILGGK